MEKKSQKYDKLWRAMEGILPDIAENIHREVKDLENSSFILGKERGRMNDQIFSPEELVYMDDTIRSLFMRGEEASMNKRVIEKIRILLLETKNGKESK